MIMENSTCTLFYTPQVILAVSPKIKQFLEELTLVNSMKNK